MKPEIERMLDLQRDDAVVHGLESRLDAIAPRLASLDRAREAAEQALARARDELSAEEQRLRELQGRVAEHRQLQERNESQLNVVRSQREASAAMLQAEQARRFVQRDETTLAELSRRIGELRQTVAGHESALLELEAEQAEERERIEGERRAIEGELREARETRQTAAARVPRNLLSTYERMRRRRPEVVFALRDGSCGNCDTAVPIQRRHAMVSGGEIDVCETCGVLLYAPD